MTESRNLLAPRRRWEPWELEAIRRFYPDYCTAWVARALRRDPSTVRRKARELSVGKSREFYAGLHTGRTGDGRGAVTLFKKGNRPKTAVPVGTINDSQAYGYVRVKVREPSVWACLHTLVWASTHVWPPPRGWMIGFRDGNRRNCDPENLTLVSKADRMRRNSMHNLPESLKQAIRLRSSLLRRIHDYETNR